MKKDIWSLVGIFCLLSGFLSIILSLVGLKFNFLAFLYSFGSGFAFLIHIVLIMAGFIILYVSKLNTEE